MNKLNKRRKTILVSDQTASTEQINISAALREVFNKFL